MTPAVDVHSPKFPLLLVPTLAVVMWEQRAIIEGKNLRNTEIRSLCLLIEGKPGFIHSSNSIVPIKNLYFFLILDINARTICSNPFLYLH